MSEQDTPANVDRYIAAYVVLRDKVKLIDDEYKAKKKEVTDKMDLLEGRIQVVLESTGGKAIRTDAGTAYIKTTYTTPLVDTEAFMNFVVEQEAYELLDKRANSTAVQEYVKEHGNLPPGVNLKAFTKVNVNRA